MKLILKKLAGQGLIEVLVTLILIAVASIALIRFQNYLAYTNNLAQQQADAVLLAINEIETLRDYQVLNNLSGYTSYQSIASGTATSTGTNATYTITWTVTSNVNPTYKKLDITTAWTDRYGSAQSARQISQVAGIDPADSAAVMSTLGGT